MRVTVGEGGLLKGEGRWKVEEGGEHMFSTRQRREAVTRLRWNFWYQNKRSLEAIERREGDSNKQFSKAFRCNILQLFSERFQTNLNIKKLQN